MKSASSHVASSGDKFSHCTNHCVTRRGCLGTALVSSTSIGSTWTLPVGETRGKSGTGMALGPRCFSGPGPAACNSGTGPSLNGDLLLPLVSSSLKLCNWWLSASTCPFVLLVQRLLCISKFVYLAVVDCCFRLNLWSLVHVINIINQIIIKTINQNY